MDSDVEDGRVVMMGLLDGASEIVPKLMVGVHSASDKPPINDAFVAVQYRNHWFWVDDCDPASKRGMAYLFQCSPFQSPEKRAVEFHRRRWR
jgi:hypothetical protein